MTTDSISEATTEAPFRDDLMKIYECDLLSRLKQEKQDGLAKGFLWGLLAMLVLFPCVNWLSKAHHPGGIVVSKTASGWEAGKSPFVEVEQEGGGSIYPDVDETLFRAIRPGDTVKPFDGDEITSQDVVQRPVPVARNHDTATAPDKPLPDTKPLLYNGGKVISKESEEFGQGGSLVVRLASGRNNSLMVPYPDFDKIHVGDTVLPHPDELSITVADVKEKK